MTERERAVVFGRDADNYDRSRPGYPRVVVDHVLSLTPVESAVEVGAGTGKATREFARPGLTLTCVEPSPGMAEVLMTQSLPGVSVELSTFEEWPGPPGPVDLVFGAQVWHWLDPSVSYAKAKAMLRPGGALALIWNIPRDRYAGFEEVYERLGPDVLAPAEDRYRRRDSDVWLDELAEAGFTGVRLETHPWSVTLDSAQHRALFASYSDHMVLPEPRRTLLLDAVQEVVEARGGTIDIDYETRVFSGFA